MGAMPSEWAGWSRPLLGKKSKCPPHLFACRMQGVGSLPWERLDEKQHICNNEEKGNQALPGQPALGYDRDRRGERGKEHAMVSSLSARRDSNAEERPG